MKLFTEKKIILASASPRRRELLKIIFNEFEIIPADIDENISNNENIEYALSRIAYTKGRTVADKHPDALVIAADTDVVKNGLVLGKPTDKADSLRMLHFLNNSEHEVITAVSIICADKEKNFLEKTKVFFNNNHVDLLEKYASSDEPYDKAGGYAVQGVGMLLVKSICGDYNNVVGLPVAELYRELRDFLQSLPKGLV